MSPVALGRRHLLGGGFALGIGTCMALAAPADATTVGPIRQLCDALINVMKIGRSAPFAQRFASLAPTIDSVFNLPVILQVSIGPTWSSLPPDQQAALLAAFRRYTIANYVSSFDNYTGQRFDVQPQPKPLPNGDQLVQTRIVTPSDSHELDYVMRPDGSSAKVVDVLADGSISRVAVQRSDFRRLMARGGAQALVASLEQKTADLSGSAALP